MARPKTPGIYRLSASKLSDFRENPRGFWLSENCGLARPRGIFPSLPGGMDRTLKKRADICRSEGKFPTELADLAKKGFKLYGDQANLDKLREWQSAPKWTDPETGCSMIFGVDDLLVDPDGLVVPIDYKTKAGEADEAYGRRYYGLQLDVYRLLLGEAAGLAMAEVGVLAFYSPSMVVGGSAHAIEIAFNATPVVLETDPERAIEAFRACIECLRGPIPMAGPKEEWDRYALNYGRLVGEHTKVAA
jgi:hypothetical protein